LHTLFAKCWSASGKPTTLASGLLSSRLLRRISLRKSTDHH